MKKLWLLVALVLCLTLPAFAEDKAVTQVEVFTYTPSVGQSLQTIKVTVSDPALLEGITAADFTFSGMCGEWLSPNTHPFSATVSGAAVNGAELTLSISNFHEKYVYVVSWDCVCAKPELSFSMTDVTATHIEVADEFAFIEGDGFSYNLFTPADTSVPQPLVLALHGMGDDANLQQNRLCIAWAEPQNQAVRPAYVLAPICPLDASFSMDGTEAVVAKSVELIHTMIDEGKVDPNRVYVVGKSMGGWNTIKALTRYNPDHLFAAGIVMCGWVDPSLTPEELANAAETPVYVLHGEQDPLVPNPGGFYDILAELGNEKALHWVYAEREFRNHQCGSQHDVEILAMEDRTFAEWLFAQSK